MSDRAATTAGVTAQIAPTGLPAAFTPVVKELLHNGSAADRAIPSGGLRVVPSAARVAKAGHEAAR